MKDVYKHISTAPLNEWVLVAWMDGDWVDVGEGLHWLGEDWKVEKEEYHIKPFAWAPLPRPKFDHTGYKPKLD